tara:strand:- start:203 stop:1189 length:987 start_codon:yes stop_codon:yes gene_type:complete
MNKFKKIGLSALAGSLVATSAFAGEISVAGGASLAVEHINGGGANGGKSFSMGNQLTFTGGGELDNGLNVSVSFILDQNDDATTAAYADKTDNDGTPFDSHSVTIASESLGTLVFHGEGGSSAQTAVDGTAAGDIWDAYDDAGALTPGASATSNNMMVYTLPTIVDGLAIAASYVPAASTNDSSPAYSLVYTGVEGLTATYAVGENNNTPDTSIEATTVKLSYAYGSFTGTYSNTDYDHATATEDQDITSYAISYTVNDELSITYGTETIEDSAAAAVEDVDAERLSASYTSGGMTITATMDQIDNIDGTTTTTEDRERWALGASFAF